MARIERKDLDYFPFIAKDGETLFILESKYKCKGTGFFTNVLRRLAATPNHHIHIKDDNKRMYFFAKTFCDEESGIDMLNIMATTGKINKVLWDEKMVIACNDFLVNAADAYRNRKSSIIKMSEIFIFYGVDINKLAEENTESSMLNEQTSASYPYSKVKDSKEENTKEEKNKYKRVLLSEINSDDFKELNSEYIKIAQSLQQLFIKNCKDVGIENSIIEKAKGTWIDDVRLMIEVDKRTVDQFRKLFRFLSDNDFWKTNILSTSKLRKQFEKLLMQSNYVKGKSNRDTTKELLSEMDQLIKKSS